MAKYKTAPNLTYESEATLKARILVFIDFRIIISEKSAVEKICDHIEPVMFYCAPAVQRKLSVPFRVKLSRPDYLE